MVGASQLALIERFHHAEYGTEAELLAACRRREMAAFEQLYQAHAPRLKSIASHITGTRQDAEDAVQETFLKAFRAIERFQGQAAISTWLCRICINTCYDLARQRQSDTERAAAQAAESGPSNSQITLKVQLDDALGRIHPNHRMVFLLFEVEGLRHMEIASILEIPEGTSKAWLFEAKKELKRLLAEARR